MSSEPIRRTMLARGVKGQRLRRTITMARDEDGGADIEDEEVESDVPQDEDQQPAKSGDRASQRQDQAFAGVIGDPDAFRR
jgi:hypothetical protein